MNLSIDTLRATATRTELALLGLAAKVAPLDAIEAETAVLAGPRTLVAPWVLRPVVSRFAVRLRMMIEGELAEESLQTLLTAMRVALFVDPRYRRDIEGFEGRLQFLSDDGEVEVAAEFTRGCLRVREGRVGDPHITIRFASGKALMRYLLNADQDVLVAMLHHEVKPVGNLNYLYRFGYLARRLQDMFLPQ